MSPLALLDPAVTLFHAVLTGIADPLQPLLGGASIAVALVALTLIVRCLLLPFSLSVLRAERARRALAPRMEHLRRRHAADPARLAREIRAAHREAGTSPVAGLLPGLAQAPAMVAVYRLCTLPVVAGVPNAVLSAGLLGLPLSAHLPGVLLTAGVLGTPGLVALVLVAGLLVVARLTSRQQVRRLQEASVGEVAALPLLLARVLPYGTVLAAAVVPVAVSLYLLASSAWLVAERAVLPRLF